MGPDQTVTTCESDTFRGDANIHILLFLCTVFNIYFLKELTVFKVFCRCGDPSETPSGFKSLSRSVSSCRLNFLQHDAQIQCVLLECTGCQEQNHHEEQAFGWSSCWLSPDNDHKHRKVLSCSEIQRLIKMVEVKSKFSLRSSGWSSLSFWFK